jgi:hypothetical protein
MKQIIPDIPIEILEKELTKDKFLRKTNNGNNEIYVVNYHNSPNVVMEIGRLREITFRYAGGGTGKEADIDIYDTADEPYQQLVVWDPERKEIIGGYRYILGNKAPKDSHGKYAIATRGLFEFSSKFKKEYFPKTIELGRSFVQPAYQSTKAGRKAIYALDNLWDGLGALVVNNPEMKYFFGKVTMYTSYNQKARDLILFFMNHYFGDKDGLVYPREPLSYHHHEDYLKPHFVLNNYKEDIKILNKLVRELGETIPPLINSYMNLSPTMKAFGTAMNYKFGEVEETGILIKIDDIYPEKKERHLKY